MHRGLENKIMKKKNKKYLHCICRYCGGIAIPIGNAYSVVTEKGELKSIRQVVKFGCESCGHIIEKYYL